MQPPQHSPFDRFARAVQAHAISLIRGGTLEMAEAAARAASGGLFNEDVAQASLAARVAAAGLSAAAPDDPLSPPVGGGGVQRPGVLDVIVTAHFRFRPPGGGAPLWRTIQTQVPITATAAEAQVAMMAEATALAEGAEYGYAGELVGEAFADVFDVLTVIGVM